VDLSSSEPRWRLFIGAPVPPAATHELFEKMGDLRRRHPDVRWARVDQLHATLVFLGQTPAAELDRLRAAVYATAEGCSPIEVDTAEAGGRAHDRRDGVAWLRIERGSRELAELAVRVDRLVGSNESASAPPRPHITIARRVTPSFLHDLRATASELRTQWTFDQIALYRSHSEPGGSRYELLANRLLTSPQAAA
jgi:RNA 2',3'-cyclic 3'-phosphodiesterase